MIDRKKVLERHNPNYKKENKYSPLSIGNGTFCFTADYTGLQSFYDEYAKPDDAFPLCTMAQWGWHSYPYPKDDEALLRLTPFGTNGRNVFYASDDSGQEDRFKRVRVNSHKFHLGIIAFEYSDNALSNKNCKPVVQTLSLWKGQLFSEFTINDENVLTETFVHPHLDCLYVRVSSALLKDRKLGIKICFPYGSHKKTGADFAAIELHSTKIFSGNISHGDHSGAEKKKREQVCVDRNIDDTCYKVFISGYGFKTRIDEKQHEIKLAAHEDRIEFCVRFEPESIPVLSVIGIENLKKQTEHTDSYDEAAVKCKEFWKSYWSYGGFMDFSDSADSRAMELERRIVLSRYLIAIQSRGNIPPAETGLTCNSWYGKYHLEMLYWHHAYLALWGRTEDLKKSLDFFKKILPAAKEIASSQGYQGARWPKMCDPSAKNTPSSIAVLLIWQQPHPIMLAHLIHRVEKNDQFLREYREIVIETAEFIKSFIHWDTKRYVLTAPFIPAQERHDPKNVLNAAFELEYFRFALEKADEWLEMLGEQKRYGEITENLSLPAVKDGVYIAHENCPATFTELPFYTDHPSMLMMYGVLNSKKVDPKIMSATLDKVLSIWDKKTFYGWDFSMMAMTACRLGRYKEAVDFLLMDSPKNTWLENGHNRQEGDDALPLYLPGNGGLLLAAAMLGAGYGGKTGSSFPAGFNVKTEGIFQYI